MMRTPTLRRLIGAGLGCVLLGTSVVAMAGPAGAADGNDGAARRRPRLTVEQRQCLKDQGITRPVRPLTPEKVQQLKDAAQACDIKLPRRHHPRLTAEQRQCLKDQGITRPVRPLTPEKVQQLKDAAQACGIQRPAAGADATAST